VSLHKKPVVPQEPPEDTLTRMKTVIVASRAAIDRDGWPQAWDELQARVTTSADYQPRTMSLGEIVTASYSLHLQQAFFRKGDGGKACLVAQAWA